MNETDILRFIYFVIMNGLSLKAILTFKLPRIKEIGVYKYLYILTFIDIIIGVLFKYIVPESILRLVYIYYVSVSLALIIIELGIIGILLNNQSVYILNKKLRENNIPRVLDNFDYIDNKLESVSNNLHNTRQYLENIDMYLNVLGIRLDLYVQRDV